MCYVSYDLAKDRKLAKETTLLDKEYTLPDKSTIRIGRERFEAAEILFNGNLSDGKPTIAEICSQALCDVERDDFLGLVQNILITGGTTMYAGLG